MSLPLLCLAAAMAAPQADLAERLSPLLAEAEQTGAWVGAMVMDADGQVLFSHEGSRLMIPASNQKVLTCAFSLGVLGPDFRFQTRIWRTEEGAVIDAPGDPTLTRDDLVAAAKTLALPEGSVIRVRSAFRPGTPPSWEWDDLPWYYAPVIQALSYDRAAFEPKAAQGAVMPLPAELGVTVARGPASGRLRAEFSRWTSEITVSGAIGDSEVSLGRMAIPNPDISAIRLLGGSPGPFSGDLPSGPPTVVLTSKPLREIVQDCLEPSDNLFAEHLLLAAAAALAPLAPGEEYSQAAAAMTDFFIREGVMSAGEMRPRDGSGLSRQNLATPAAILKTHPVGRNAIWRPLDERFGRARRRNTADSAERHAICRQDRHDQRREHAERRRFHSKARSSQVCLPVFQQCPACGTNSAASAGRIHRRMRER